MLSCDLMKIDPMDIDVVQRDGMGRARCGCARTCFKMMRASCGEQEHDIPTVKIPPPPQKIRKTDKLQSLKACAFCTQQVHDFGQRVVADCTSCIGQFPLKLPSLKAGKV